jgi:Cytochrome c, mono- and diheme variants
MLRRFIALVVAGVCAVEAWAIERTVEGIEWDALEKRVEAEAGQVNAEFLFELKNTGAEPLEILDLSTSCSCSAAIMREQPWVIAPGASDEVRVVMDLRSRRGGLTKTVYVMTNRGEQLLLVHANVPPPPAVQREMNMMMAQADRQAVLRGDCARCHVTPAEGKHGKELFEVACQICHGAEHRASFVPDLAVAKEGRDAAYWENWIRNGAEGTMMPAFAKERGGFLDDGQVASLVGYLTGEFGRRAVATTDGH